MFEINVHNK